ncbi:zinc finger protein OZF-like [Sparus aurata]|uniref:zinc finger protein OZF-like n=1 Tax=Sparus aurata TaxID=8175 RepID=UPI0011C17FEC|nr:zinc finger protein OZF-like [Sparus aurata]
MSKVQTLRVFVKQRLTAAAEEIFELFERTIAEYEEELCRHRKLLDAVLQPQVQLHRTDVQLLSVSKEEVPSEQQDWSSGPDQKEPPEPPHIKEEQQEIWTNQEEDDVTEVTFTPVTVKSEVDDGINCGGPEPVRNFKPDTHLQPVTHDKSPDVSVGGWVLDETREPQSGLKLPNNYRRVTTGEKSFPCLDCGKTFSQNANLKTHMRIHRGEKPFSCSFCSKRFIQKIHLVRHLALHTGEKRHSCSACGNRFTWHYQLKKHQCVGRQSSHIHLSQEHLKMEADGEDCGELEPAKSLYPERATSFSHDGQLQKHNRVQTGLRSFSCSVCGKKYPRKKSLTDHMRIHSEGNGFSCSVCKKTFPWRGNVVTHMRIHTGEKPFSCSICGRGFTTGSNLTAHIRVHTREKPFTCSVCNVRFCDRSTLSRHLRIHTREKPFTCSVCGKSIALYGNLRRHMRIHTGDTI